MQISRDLIEKAKLRTIHQILGLNPNRRISVRCHLHPDRSPSLCVYPDGSWYCFGCAEHGQDSISYLTKSGISFVEAVKYLLS